MTDDHLLQLGTQTHGWVRGGVRVRLARVHPSMNGRLKGLLGTVGEVCFPDDRRDDRDKVRVRFDGLGGVWWVGVRYLEGA